MAKFAAFLRGINVGGNKIVKMDELKKTFESMGFKNVRTVLASGNVLFEGVKTKTETLSKKLSNNLNDKFGFEIGVIVRSINDLKDLSDSNPFKEIDVTPQTRLFITFLSEKPDYSLKIPYESSDKNFKILRVTQSEIVSVLTVAPTSKTIELMNILEKEFGKKITTRNWKTVERLLK